MMTIKILAFGIARDIVGGSTFEVQITEGATVFELQEHLVSQYPQFDNLASMLIAVNLEYGVYDTILKETDEVALIPPVSGG